MSKFNTVTTRPARGSGPVATVAPAAGRAAPVTHEGAPAFARDARSELFMLAVANLVGEDTFYETAGDRDLRYRTLVRQVALQDAAWLARMLRWLRGDANMRSASIVGAVEMVHARLEAAAASVPAYELPGVTTARGIDRWVIDQVCQRADEPGELLAYWMSRYGRQIPKPVKRGVADAAVRLYNERSLLKYDTASHGVRFADVIELTRPAPAAGWQGDLFRHALDRRHDRANGIPESLRTVARNALMRSEAEPQDWLNPDLLRDAGMTWEDALSAVGSRVAKARLWEALIPSMGVMALARNLRNFDEAGVSDAAAAAALAKFVDPAVIARSRMFPYRWLSAYEQAPSLRWAHALDQAATLSVANVPALTGRSLVLIDTSASMTSTGMSRRSKVSPLQAGALFGVALAIRGAADVYGFADGVFVHKVPAGGSLLRTTSDLVKRAGEVGHGTRIAEAIARTFRPDRHDRVFIVSDMQTMEYVDGYTRGSALYGAPQLAGSRGVAAPLPASTPVYAFNLGGYANTSLDLSEPGRVEFGGLTDATFRMVPLIEAGRAAAWPF